MNPSVIGNDQLAVENSRLLEELEIAYKNMELIIEQANQEKKIAYQELEKKFHALEQLYEELSKKENMLIHMEKLSSIGQFISEIIHELKSPLAAIAAHAELIKIYEPPPDILEGVENISEQVHRLNEYMNRFRGMIYRGQEDFSVFDLNQNLGECLGTIEIIKPKDISLRVEFCDEMLPIKGDPYQIHQIFLNLSKNAFDAMESQGNGVLAFKTAAVSPAWLAGSKNFSAVRALPETAWKKILSKTEKFALVEVHDNGKGIRPGSLPEIFKAFFTTKERGKGTGLGLSICSDIACRHEGNLAVKSQPGQGTTFQFVLPCSTPEAAT